MNKRKEKWLAESIEWLLKDPPTKMICMDRDQYEYLHKLAPDVHIPKDDEDHWWMDREKAEEILKSIHERFNQALEILAGAFEHIARSMEPVTDALASFAEAVQKAKEEAEK